MGGFRSLYMSRSIGTGFDVLARVLSYHPETAFIRAFVSYPAVELGSEAVPARPLSPDHDFIQVLRVSVAALNPLTHLSPHQYIVRNRTTNSAANSKRVGMDSSSWGECFCQRSFHRETPA
ncbi:TPA_asm: hypothetical protein [Pseudomonas phage vB_PaeS-D14O]|nr:TPA_asm: hypothetical protein [Pseudomonas phage vB_PaeS-D14O]